MLALNDSGWILIVWGSIVVTWYWWLNSWSKPTNKLPDGLTYEERLKKDEETIAELKKRGLEDEGFF